MVSEYDVDAASPTNGQPEQDKGNSMSEMRMQAFLRPGDPASDWWPDHAATGMPALHDASHNLREACFQTLTPYL
jgi:hypothetical protein